MEEIWMQIWWFLSQDYNFRLLWILYFIVRIPNTRFCSHILPSLWVSLPAHCFPWSLSLWPLLQCSIRWVCSWQCSYWKYGQ
jgi:hypothetical protein